MALNNSQLRLRSHTSSMNVTFAQVLKEDAVVEGSLALKARQAEGTGEERGWGGGGTETVGE